jgi:hypothetical protein
VWLNEKPAAEALERLTRAFKRNATSINQALELVSKAWSVVSGAVGAVADFAIESAKAAMDAEKVERRFVAALAARGERVAEVKARIDALADAQQQLLGIDAEETKQLAATLLQLGVRSDKLEEATRATIGLAQVTGQDLPEAGRIVAKVFQGHTEALSRVGLKTEDAAKATVELVRMYDVAAAQGQTLETRLKALNENWGDFREALGGAVTGSGALIASVDSLSNAVRGLQEWFASTEGRQVINDFFALLASGASMAIDGTLGLIKAVRTIRVMIGTTRETAKVEAMDPLTHFTLADYDRQIATLEKINRLNRFQAKALSTLREQRRRFREELANRPYRGAEQEVFIDIETQVEKIAADLADRLRTAGKGGIVGTEPPSPPARPGGVRPGEEEREQAAKKEQQLKERVTRWRQDELQKERDQRKSAQEAIQDWELRSRINFLRQAEIVEETARQRRKALEEEEYAAKKQRQEEYQQTALGAVGTFSRIFSSALTAAMTTDESFGQALGRMLGGAIMQFGATLVEAGVFVSLWSLASTLLPAVFPGPGPAGIAVGGAMVAAGAGIIAAGAAMTGAGSGSRASAAGGAGSAVGVTAAGGYAAARTRLPETAPPPFRGPSTTVINVTFGRGVVMGTPRQIAREIGEYLRQGATLSPVGAR